MSSLTLCLRFRERDQPIQDHVGVCPSPIRERLEEEASSSGTILPLQPSVLHGSVDFAKRCTGFKRVNAVFRCEGEW
jgi:hypothetical protein